MKEKMELMIRKLARSIEEFTLYTILTPVFIVFEVFLEVLIPTYTAAIIDSISGVKAGGMDNVGKYGALLVLMAALSLVFGALSGICASRASCGFARNLRRNMYHNIQSFSFFNIDKFSTASLVTRMTTDVSNVQMSFQMLIRIAVRCPIMLVSALILTFQVEPRIALIYLITIPILGGGLFLIIKKAFPIFERVFKTYDKLNLIVQENLRGIRVVKSYVRSDHEIGKFEEVSNSVFKDFSKAEKLIAFNSPLMQLCVYGCMILVSWFSAHFIIDGSMTTGNLTSLITYTMQILMSLMMMSMVFVMITISRASAERITAVLGEVSDIESPPQPVTEVRDGSIKFRNVFFSYSKDSSNPCLIDIDLEIASGQTVGILGGTGSSKTSLVQLIPRLYDATDGTVYVGGHDVRDYDLETLRENVAMVLQKNELFSGTVKENLRWGNENATDEELVRVCKLAQADDFIQAMPEGYDTHIEQGGANVSGGQKQRLCIARALLKRPKILILDDSTSAVDTATDAKIRRAFIEEIPDTTKIIIAQRVSSVQDADKIIVMEGGRIEALGTHEELLASNRIYREVFVSQTKGGEEDE